MHRDVVPNRTSRPTCVLRESYHDGTRVRTRTLANLSTLTDAQINALRAVLRGEPRQPVEELFDVIRSLPQGHVHAVSVAMHQLGFARLRSSRAQPARALVCALVAARILVPPHHARVAHHDAGAAVRGGRGGRGGSVSRDGLAACAPGGD